ncbi:MAG: UDP-N-acetylmuramoyl-L-alanine--D-glutamate ligase [Desulfobacteraceae bacterium]|nr:UDP-N-acetylmuramoyl-L-alanine--D-glutamate ligase [Desulfobacteraceae bacterium]
MTAVNENPCRIEPGMHVVIAGLGKSGLSAAKYLLQLGVRVSVSEGGRADRLEGDVLRWFEEKGVFLETGGHSSELFLAADAVLASPGVPLDLPVLAEARRQGIPVLGELALAPARLATPVVAVTGTNGKTTVTTLLGGMFQAAGGEVFVGGNIGTPLTDYLAGPQQAEVAVLEVSSFQLDAAGGFRPRVGVLLNITPDHLDRYESFAAYAASKLRLFAAQGPGDAAVLNADDPVLADLLAGEGTSRFPGQVYLFGTAIGTAAGARLDGSTVTLAGLPGQERPEVYELAATRLGAPPNTENAAAAILAARLQGCPEAATRAALASFVPLGHRLTLVAEIEGVRFYDDSKATNVGAVQAALRGLDRPAVLIAGGRDKESDFTLLRPEVAGKVKEAVLIGEAAGKMAAALGDLVPIERAGSMGEAVRLAFAGAAAGEAVLLSPACASFDMFKSYADRGEVFRREVLDLQAERAAACRRAC